MGIRLGLRISRPRGIHEELRVPRPHAFDAGHDVAAQVVGHGRHTVHGHGHALEAEAVHVPNEAVEGGGRRRDGQFDVACKGGKGAGRVVRAHVAYHPHPSVGKTELVGAGRHGAEVVCLALVDRCRRVVARRGGEEPCVTIEILAFDRIQADPDPRLTRDAGVVHTERGAPLLDCLLRHVRAYIVRADDGERAAIAEVLAGGLDLRQRDRATPCAPSRPCRRTHRPSRRYRPCYGRCRALGCPAA